MFWRWILSAGEAGTANSTQARSWWPTSLATRTKLTLLVGLALVQAAGLTIHALDRIDLQREAELRNIGARAREIYRSVVATSEPERQAELKELDLPTGVEATIGDAPPLEPAVLTPVPFRQDLHLNQPNTFRRGNHWKDLVVRGMPWDGMLTIGMEFPESGWLILKMPVPRPRPWHSPTFLIAFVLMTAAAAVLSFWAVGQLTGPVATLAAAAERLGRDVNSPPLPEGGPDEVARAAIAFNTMASRIRRFVQDRTFMLTAIGHDLRTPITRLKLRAEFIEDDEQRGKFLADLDELDTMVSATLAFGRDSADAEPAVQLDLCALLRTVLDEAADARPDAAEKLKYSGPDHLVLTGRTVALKRAFANLIGNAVKYAGGAQVDVQPKRHGHVTVVVQDDGQGLPPDELERVFEPFYRVENSRNRETGGTGLGLPIARNIFRAHGGDVTLANRPSNGAKATVTLPA
jgi:signal transduction histidine kinase